MEKTFTHLQALDEITAIAERLDAWADTARIVYMQRTDGSSEWQAAKNEHDNYRDLARRLMTVATALDKGE